MIFNSLRFIFYIVAILWLFITTGYYVKNKFNLFKQVNVITKGFIVNFVFQCVIWFVMNIVLLLLAKVKIITYDKMFSYSAFIVPVTMATILFISFVFVQVNVYKQYKTIVGDIFNFIKNNKVLFLVMLVFVLFSQNKILLLSHGYTDDWLYVSASSKNYFLWSVEPYKYFGVHSDGIIGNTQHFVTTFMISIQQMFYYIFGVNTRYLQLMFNYISFNVALSVVACSIMFQVSKILKIQSWSYLLGILYLIFESFNYFQRIFPQMFYGMGQVAVIIVPLLILYVLINKKLHWLEISIICIFGLILHPISVLFIITLFIIRFASNNKILTSNYFYLVVIGLIIIVALYGTYVLHKVDWTTTPKIKDDEIKRYFTGANLTKWMPKWRFLSGILYVLPLVVKNKKLKLVSIIIAIMAVISTNFYIAYYLTIATRSLNFLVLRYFEIIFFFALIYLCPMWFNEIKTWDYPKFKYAKIAGFILFAIICVLMIRPRSHVYENTVQKLFGNFTEINVNNLNSTPDVVKEVEKFSKKGTVSMYVPFDIKDYRIVIPYVFDDTYRINRNLDYGKENGLFFYLNKDNLKGFLNYDIWQKNVGKADYLAFPEDDDGNLPTYTHFRTQLAKHYNFVKKMQLNITSNSKNTNFYIYKLKTSKIK